MNGPQKSPRSGMPGIDIRTLPNINPARMALTVSAAGDGLQRLLVDVHSMLAGIKNAHASGRKIDPRTAAAVGMLVNNINTLATVREAQKVALLAEAYVTPEGAQMPTAGEAK